MVYYSIKKFIQYLKSIIRIMQTSSLKNSARLIGNIGNDPQIFNLKNNNKMAKFSLATSERYKNKNGEWVSDTQWHNIIVFGQLAGIVERFYKKGTEVALEGKIVNNSYEDKLGVKRYSTQIQVNEMNILSKRDK